MGRLVAVVLPWLPACGGAPGATLSETREQMGTVVSITVAGGAGPSAAAAIDAAFAEIEGIEALMSTFNPRSELSVLNRDGSIEAGAELLDVLRCALEVHRLSAGAFDVTVQSLSELYASSFEDRGGPPSPVEIGSALALVDAGGIAIEGRRISLPPGVRVTLDGIAKGYAIDRAIEVLRASGVSGALVDAGGDVRALGRKGSAPWNVAMQDPRDARSFLTVISLEDRAVATSGDYRRYFDPEMKLHHILDPRSGVSARGVISVTVTARTAMMADALATSVFVLGVEKGIELVEGLEGIEAFLVTDERSIVTSSGW